MKASVEPLEGNKVKVSVEVDEAEFDRAVDAAFRKIAREVRIPGFRPGKAPRKVLEGRLGSEVGREQALQDSVPEFYAQALVENDVDAIAPPEIDITNGREGDGPVAFDAVVEIRPEVEVAGYDGLRVTVDRPDLDDTQLDAQIDRMREVQATLAEVDRPAIDGDVVTIDISGTQNGEPREGVTADDYSYSIGSDLIPEVDRQLRGAKVGDILQFETTLPGEAEGDDPTELRVLVKQISEKVLPAADDEWASENSEYDTIDELRGSIRERMLLVAKARAQAQLRERATDALAELVAEEPPSTLIDHEVQHQLQDLALRLRAQGGDLEQWIASTGRDPDELTAEMRKDANRSVKFDLALRAVADSEQIECTDDDLDTEIQELATRLKEKPARVRAQFERGGQLLAVRSDIRKRKAFDWLLERVEIVDQDGAALDRADLELDTDEAENVSTAPTDDATDIADEADADTETDAE